MLPVRPRVNLGVIAIKAYSAFPKGPALLELHHQIVYCHISMTLIAGEGSYSFVEMLLMYSVASAYWAKNRVREGSHPMYLCFLLFLCGDSFSQFPNTLQKRWVVLQRDFFCFPYRLGLSDILRLSVSLLIMPKDPTITGTVIVLRYHIFHFLVYTHTKDNPIFFKQTRS